MKKLLALIVEHKLNNNNLSALIDRIETLLDDCDSVTYPKEFKNQMKLALDEPRSLLSQGNYSHHTILDVLEEMERLIVDYLTGAHKGSIIIAFYIKIQYWYGGGRRSLLSNRQRKVRTPRK